MVAQIHKMKDFFFLQEGKQEHVCMQRPSNHVKTELEDEEIYFYVLLPREIVSSWWTAKRGTQEKF